MLARMAISLRFWRSDAEGLSPGVSIWRQWSTGRRARMDKQRCTDPAAAGRRSDDRSSNGARPEHVDRAEKLLKMRGTGDHYRKVAVERKIRELSPDVHAAATARLSGPVRQPKAPAHVHQSGSTSTPSHRTPPARATRQRPPAVTTSGSHPPAGTQMEMTTDFAESAPDLLFREYQMGRLPQKMGGTRLGWPLNEDAKSLLRKFDKLGRVAADIGKNAISSSGRSTNTSPGSWRGWSKSVRRSASGRPKIPRWPRPSTNTRRAFQSYEPGWTR